MKATLILWPVLAQVLLTIVMYVRLAVVKLHEVKAGNVDVKAVALNQEAWPASVRLVNNNLRNQFETPVIFYTLCLILWGLSAVDTVAMIIACAYTATRISHAYVHTGTNIVKHRQPLFIAGFALLAALFGLTVRAVVAV